MKRTLIAAAGLAAAAGISTGAAVAQDERRDRLVQVGQPVRVDVNGSFLSPLVERFGDVRTGRGVFVAGNTILRADPGRRVCLDSRTNVQDNVLILGLRDRPGRRLDCARFGSETGRRTSVAHQASVVNSRIGDFTFIGFRARIENSVIADGAFVLHATTIRNVRIPRDRLVPVGATVTTQAQADALPRKAEAQAEFQREVLEVNREFSEEYRELYERRGYDAVVGISRSPRTTFNRGRAPRIGPGLEREPFARIVGDVRLGRSAEVGRRTSIRADEGSPIVVGDDAEIEDRVTFHALRGDQHPHRQRARHGRQRRPPRAARRGRPADRRGRRDPLPRRRRHRRHGGDRRRRRRPRRRPDRDPRRRARARGHDRHDPGAGGRAAGRALTDDATTTVGGSGKNDPMPTKKDDLPSTLKRSPEKVQDTYAETLDSAHESYDSEQRAHRTAWSAVKHVAEKQGDHWELKDEKGPSDPQAARGGKAARDDPTSTYGGVDASKSKQELYEQAKKAGIEGRSTMDKQELAQALKRHSDRETARARRS